MTKIIFLVVLLQTVLASQNWHDVRLKANLNTAKGSELIQLPWITEDMALAIVRFRREYGEYNTVDELELAFAKARLNVDLDTLKKNLRLYCVSKGEWNLKLANNWHDLYPYQLQIYTFDSKGTLALVFLPEGGNMLIGCGSADDEKVIDEVKKVLVRRSKGRIKKPIIDWLIIPDLKPTSYGNLKKVLKEFRVKRVYTLDYGKVPAEKATISLLKMIKTLEDNRVKPIVFEAGTKIDFLQQKYHVVIDVIYPRWEVNEDTASMFYLRYGEHSFLFAGDMGKGDLLDIFKGGYSERLRRIYTPLRYIYTISDEARDMFEQVYVGNVIYSAKGKGVFCSDGVLCYIGDPTKSPPPKKSPYKFVGRR